MQYYLETLGDERFQQLCQALLARTFPKTQCLPVGQRDGGRDAFARSFRGGRPKNFTVFQVKYSRAPASKDARELIQETIRSEAPKIKALIERGSTEYYLLTNVSGTSYLDHGSIDKANEELSKGLGINAMCWWRDDIERRIDAEPNIKWSYPEIIKGTDLLQFLCEATNQGEAQRRVEALRSFMVHQYRYDDKLKFKQIDLHKGIADMFVDVPARLLVNDEQRRSDKWKLTISSWLEEDRTLPSDFLEIEEGYVRREPPKLGALQLLVNPDFSGHFPQVVVEGAPGQGKSTITQFLCQIHRMILLGRHEISKVAQRNRPADVRIPFRVDLRDYATWISGFDPFSENAGVARPIDSSPVLESFLAFLVSHHTGRSFSADDFAAIAKSSQLLVVLDGFDEVADVGLRNRIVVEVSNASARVAEDALSAQFVVTSRPAAFANSPGFSRDEFQYLELASLTQPVIMEYAAKWLDGRDTEPRERRDVTRVLTDKLRQPHVRDLARNPMQLAILLNLISVRGASLPDQRTALYQSYIDIFLNREADKSPVVRDHRSVLLKIHRYLAWILQTEAESERGGGNISEGRLKAVLHRFLEDEGHSTELVSYLFQGVVERVFVLVSRVQGTFEFEVQPIREYFAARYLYDTAPYSPAGQIITGTLPDRFVGLAKNFYWLNVTRFFAGCYSSGELASLRYGLKQIEEDTNFQHIGHISELTMTLLQDHVFADQPLLSADITEWLLKEPRLTFMLARRNAFSYDISLAVPEGRSRDTLVAFMKRLILSNTHLDRLYAASRAFKSNQEDDAVIEFWLSLRQSLADEARWLWIGQVMDVFDRMPLAQFRSLLQTVPEAAATALYSGRTDLLEEISGAWYLAFRRALSQPGYMGLRFELPKSDEGYFCFVLLRLLSAEQHEFGRLPVEDEIFYSKIMSDRPAGSTDKYNRDKFLQGCERLFEGRQSALATSAAEILELPAKEVWGRTALWDKFFVELVNANGDEEEIVPRALFFVKYYKLVSSIDLSDNECELGLIEYGAALRSACRTPEIVIGHLGALRVRGSKRFHFALLAALSFLSLDALIEHGRWLGELVDELDEAKWRQFSASYSEMPFSRTSKREPSRRLVRKNNQLSYSSRLVALFLARFDLRIGWVLFSGLLKSYRGDDAVLIEKTIFALLSKVGTKELDWDDVISFTKYAYEQQKLPVFSFRHRQKHVGSIMPVRNARAVCSDPGAYPLDLVEVAEQVLSQSVGKQAVALAEVSESGGWFSLSR